MAEEENSAFEVPEQETGKKRQFNLLNDVPKHLSKKMKRDELYKPPTAEEMSQLKEAETMFHSSLFRLQIDELLSETQAKMKKYQERLQSWLESLKTLLQSLPSSETYEVHDLSWIGKDIKVPILQFPKNKRGLFQFVPPSQVLEIGSYSLNTVCTPEHIIDVAVCIPKACFQKLDFLNHLYHKKRALYLVYLAKSLKNNDLVEEFEYSYHNNYHLKPVLILKPKGKLAKHFSVHLLPFPESETFKCNRFIPVTNNVRPSWFFQNTNNTEESTNIPTPGYNSGILSDLLLPDLNMFLKEKVSSQSIKDGIMLLKVWCIQRELYGGQALTGFLINMIVSYLLMKKKISPLMSSYQVFRNALLILTKENWTEQGVNLCEKPTNGNPTMEDFHKAFDVVFVDPSGFLNLSYFMTADSFLMLQHEAKLALKILDSTSSDSFSLLFINKVPFCRKFEYLVHFSKPKRFKKYCSALNVKQAVLDNGGDSVASIIPNLCRLLKNGLGCRVHLVAAEISAVPHWPLHEKPPDPNHVKHATLGLLINQERAFNNLEKGPLADDPKSVEFRKFWGNKSELRRFKDGSICEAVLWPAETIQEKRLVLPQMIRYIFQRHADIKQDEVFCTGTELDALLSLPKEILPEGSSPYGTGEEFFLNLMQSYTSLTKILRKLDGLPLVISAIQGTSAAFRFSEVFPPYPRLYPLEKNSCIKNAGVLAIKEDPTKCPSWVPALEVVLHFEGSGKWPDDIEALRRIKAAFHIKISDCLRSQCGLASKVSPSFVDLLMDGYVFRLVVASHKEITLLKQVKTPEGMIKLKENKESRELEYSTEILPQLNSILHGLHQQHNAFGTACRLAKRWAAAHFLHDYISDIIIELLMSFIFIAPEPFTCPSSPQTAFQRFLALIHMHDWESNPLIVNFNNKMTKTEIAEVQSHFTSQRATLPAMVICTSLDKSGALWMRELLPSAVILRRLVQLSKISLETLEEYLYLSQTSDFKQIFRPPLTPYAVLIHLNKQYVPKKHFAIDLSENIKLKPFKKYNKREKEKIPVVQFDPVQFYLKELRETFDEFAMFFYDTYGGDFIAVLQRPNAFESRLFKSSHINGCMISGANADGTSNVVPNIEAMLTDFTVLGGELVKSIEIRPEKLIVG